MLIPYGFSDKTEEDYELLLYVNDVNRGYTETLATYGTDGYVNTVYTYGNERLISEQFGKSSYYTYNGRGDVSSQLSDTGAPQVSYSYDAYGNYAATAASDNPYKFNAEAFDYSTGLQYLRARYYDNSIGGFITQDSYRGTLTNPSTLNLYDYVGNDPINKIDPSGHWDVLNKIKKVGSSVLNVGKTIVTNVANTIKATATNVVNAVKNTVVSAVSIVKNAVVDTWNTVKNTVAAGLNKVSRFKSLVTNNSYIKKSTQTAENYSYKRDCDSFSYSKLTTAPVPISELINALLNAFYSFEDNPKGLDLKYENYCLGGLDMAPKFGPYDNDFPYDPNEKATMDDYISWHKWGFLNFGASFFMKDASRAYSHYRDGTGESMWINYERAYQEDS